MTKKYVGLAGIAERFAVEKITVKKWRERNLGFPEPVEVVSNMFLYDEDAVIDWGIETGRLVETSRRSES
jgi:hypothetical protein